jgi:hypothetical protein
MGNSNVIEKVLNNVKIRKKSYSICLLLPIKSDITSGISLLDDNFEARVNPRFFQSTSINFLTTFPKEF